jgi:hypothetical protein
VPPTEPLAPLVLSAVIDAPPAPPAPTVTATVPGRSSAGIETTVSWPPPAPEPPARPLVPRRPDPPPAPPLTQQTTTCSAPTGLVHVPLTSNTWTTVPTTPGACAPANPWAPCAPFTTPDRWTSSSSVSPSGYAADFGLMVAILSGLSDGTGSS